MRMHAEARVRSNAVLVDHAQGVEIHMLRIVVIGKAERMTGVEPAMFGMAPVVGFSNLDHEGAFVTVN